MDSHSPVRVQSPDDVVWLRLKFARVEEHLVEYSTEDDGSATETIRELKCKSGPIPWVMRFANG